jgi:hypothetical protein
MQKQSVLPPFGLWLVGLLYIFETVNLKLPRLAVPLLLPMAWNDVLDGLLLPLAAAFLARRNFGSLPFGFTALPFALLCLKLLGSGAHMVAATMTEVSRGTSGAAAAAAAGRAAFLHEGWSHWLGHAGELGLLACLVWQSSARRAQAEDQGMEAPGHLVAAVHGLAAGVHGVSTGTAPALLLVWSAVALLVVRRQRALTSSVMRYAYIFCILSCAFVLSWAVAHGGSLPTFDEVNRADASV